jgi:hypothetical protein
MLGELPEVDFGRFKRWWSVPIGAVCAVLGMDRNACANAYFRFRAKGGAAGLCDRSSPSHRSPAAIAHGTTQPLLTKICTRPSSSAGSREPACGDSEPSPRLGVGTVKGHDQKKKGAERRLSWRKPRVSEC